MVDANKSKKTMSKVAAHVKNATEVVRGKAKVAAGKRSGNKKLQTEGQLDKLKGHTRQAGQDIKEALDE